MTAAAAARRGNGQQRRQCCSNGRGSDRHDGGQRRLWRGEGLTAEQAAPVNGRRWCRQRRGFDVGAVNNARALSDRSEAMKNCVGLSVYMQRSDVSRSASSYMLHGGYNKRRQTKLRPSGANEFNQKHY
ncbi:hypothetical protein Scep_007064 [Stephania cephalantha]|uniref:Uncharacterized protein n=1 Tax=Stephania cephalantha TaxID=152367 RepID=A0AAP0KBQ3_9MAGN